MVLVQLNNGTGRLWNSIGFHLAAFLIFFGSAASTAAETYVPWSEQFHLFPQDSQGFSVVSPSSDSRIVYVSNQGNDSSGQVYSAAEIGGDVFNPVNFQPFATIGAALSQLRDGYPDWILLERGGMWSISSTIRFPSGRSASERMVFGSYGSNQSRPVVHNNGMAFEARSGTHNVALLGIEVYANHRDPDSSNFPGFGAAQAISIGLSIISNGGSNTGFLIEDCHFRFNQINVQGDSNALDVVFRRNIITDSYSTNGHAQGLYSRNGELLIEENVFDHNGWLSQQQGSGSNQAEGQATMFNHNIYFSAVNNTIVRRNIFLRSSSIHNKFTANPTSGVDTIRSRNVLIENNVYVDGEIGIHAGGNDNNDNGSRFQGFQILNNAFTHLGESRPTNRSLAWGIVVDDWDGGEVRGNYFTEFSTAVNSNVVALRIGGHSRNVNITSNASYNYTGRAIIEFLADIDSTASVQVQSNEITSSTANGVLLSFQQGINFGATFNGNIFDSVRDPAAWVSIGQDPMSLDELANLVPVAPSSEPPSPENFRALDAYLNTLGYQNRASYYQALRNQTRWNRDERLSAMSTLSFLSGDPVTGPVRPNPPVILN